MEDTTPPAEYKIPAYRRYIMMLGMTGMIAFFWIMQALQPTFWGGVSAIFFTVVCIWSWVRMAENFRPRNP